jgi:hypothetical protein
MVDALNTLQSSVTKTATFNGSAVTLPYGTPRRGLVARVLYSAATNASGSNSVTFSVDTSVDGGTTWVSTNAAPIALSTTAQTGELFIPFNFAPGAPSTATARLSATFSGAGSTPTITYSGDLGDSMP